MKFSGSPSAVSVFQTGVFCLSVAAVAPPCLSAASTSSTCRHLPSSASSASHAAASRPDEKFSRKSTITSPYKIRVTHYPGIWHVKFVETYDSCRWTREFCFLRKTDQLKTKPPTHVTQNDISKTK